MMPETLLAAAAAATAAAVSAAAASTSPSACSSACNMTSDANGQLQNQGPGPPLLTSAGTSATPFASTSAASCAGSFFSFLAFFAFGRPFANATLVSVAAPCSAWPSATKLMAHYCPLQRSAQERVCETCSADAAFLFFLSFWARRSPAQTHSNASDWPRLPVCECGASPCRAMSIGSPSAQSAVTEDMTKIAGTADVQDAGSEPQQPLGPEPLHCRWEPIQLISCA